MRSFILYSGRSPRQDPAAVVVPWQQHSLGMVIRESFIWVGTGQISSRWAHQRFTSACFLQQPLRLSEEDLNPDLMGPMGFHCLT